MKKITTLTLALFTTAALAGVANADAAKPAPGQPGPRVDRIVEHMNKDLNLTADQQAKLKTIFQEEGTKMQRVRQETHNRVDQVLTAEQKTKAKELRQERIKHFKEKRQEWKKEHAQKQ